MNKKKGFLGMALAFILNNLLSVVVCLLIMTLFSFVLDTKFGWIMHVVMLVAFLFFVYHQAWQYGDRDLNNNFGNRNLTALLGGLIAAIPTLLLAIFALLIEIGAYVPNFTIWGQATITAVYRFWNMPFIIMFDLFKAVPVLYFLPCIVMPCLTTVGYLFGYKNIKISDYIYYAREENE